MSRFLIAVWPIPGHYYPNLTVAHALRARGHEVAFVTGTRARAVIEGQGFTCLTFQHVDERGFDRIFFEAQPDAPWWMPSMWTRRSRSFNWLVGLLPGQVEDVEAAIDQWRPDVLVCDPTLWGSFLVAAQRKNIRTAIFAYIPFCPAPGRDIPPLGFGLMPPQSLGARLKTAMARRAFQIATERFREAANALRVHHGLETIRESVSEFALRAPLYLIAGTRELDFNRTDLPSTVHYVGPCNWSRPRTSPSPPWLDTLRRDQPWVHVTEGTILTGVPELSRAAAIGLADLPIQVIIAASRPGDGESLGIGPTASNTVLEHWVNIHYDELLPRTAVVVTSGGAGTVLASLSLGVPVIIVPTEWDKPDVAARVAAAGAGIRILPSACTPAGLRSAVERMLSDGSFRESALRLSASIRQHGGPAEAAKFLESL